MPNKIDISKVEKICVDVRRWVENTQEQYQIWQDDLCGSCGIASYLIWLQLDKLGYNPLLCFGIGHVFVLCQSYLIDVTASQFDAEEFNDIIITQYQFNLRQYPFWSTGKGYIFNKKTIKQAKNIINDWPNVQRWDCDCEIYDEIESYIKKKGIKNVMESGCIFNKSYKINSRS